MLQEEVRTRFVNYLESTGTSQKFIASRLEEKIPLDVLSRWKTGSRDLWDNHLMLISEYLTQHNA
ncbi:MAG: hypothetical protein K0R15_643 [Clostridiales bacterium]|jgi:hypothetical protein|nr:hypothetical protein [Clostridiales bacterium]